MVQMSFPNGMKICGARGGSFDKGNSNNDDHDGIIG